MPITYNVIERGEPGVPGGGTRKFYASAISQGETEIDDLTKLIEKISTVSGADIRAVLYALVDVVPDALADGDIVRIGDLGYFRVGLSSNGHEKEEEVSEESITDTRILFMPGPRFDRMLNNLDFQRA